jgi:CrtC N-terminal lipocalin domain
MAGAPASTMERLLVERQRSRRWNHSSALALRCIPTRVAGGLAGFSHYYSATRMRAAGVLRTHGKCLALTGQSWFDHQWVTTATTRSG